MNRSFLELSDKQWKLIQELMDWNLPLQRGTPRRDLRKV